MLLQWLLEQVRHPAQGTCIARFAVTAILVIRYLRFRSARLGVSSAHHTTLLEPSPSIFLTSPYLYHITPTFLPLFLSMYPPQLN